MTLGLSTKLNTTFEDAVERATRALADQGFGVLTRIDVKATLKQKLGTNMEDYLILGCLQSDTGAPSSGGGSPDRSVVAMQRRGASRSGRPG